MPLPSALMGGGLSPATEYRNMATFLNKPKQPEATGINKQRNNPTAVRKVSRYVKNLPMRKPRPGTLFLIFWGLFLTGAAMVYLLYLQPSRLGKTVSDSLQSTFQVQCGIRQVDLAIFPYPAVIIQELTLQLPPNPESDATMRANVRVESCRAELSWLSLVRFKPVLHRVTLESPSVQIIVSGDAVEAAPKALADVNMALPPTPEITLGSTTLGLDLLGNDSPLPPEIQPNTQWDWFQHLPVIPTLLRGVTLNINRGTVTFARTAYSPNAEGTDTAKAGTSSVVTGINGTMRLPGIFRGHARIEVDAIEIQKPGMPRISISQTSINSSSFYAANATHSAKSGEWEGDFALETHVQMQALDETLGRTIEEPYRYFPMPKPLRIELKLKFFAEPQKHIFTMDGELEALAALVMNGHSTPIIATIFFNIDQPDLVNIEYMHLTMDADSASITGTLTGLREGDPVLTGTTEIQHFSLIRWFDFGRHMPNGLQVALDNISGTMDFTLSKRGIVAPHLEAHTSGMTLTGQGSCADFLEPDVLISGTVPEADLNVLFPEMSGKYVDAPVLPPPALYAMSEPDEPATPARVGYDIHVMAKKALIWNLTANDVDCHVLASELPIRPAGYPSLTPLDFATLTPKQLGPRPAKGSILRITVDNLYGGKGESYVHIDTISRVLVAARDISLDKPVELIVGYPALQGKLRADTDLQMSGSSALHILNSLKGSVNATVSNGKFGKSDGFFQPFRSLSVQTVAQAKQVPGNTLPPRMDYIGTWKASLDTDQWSVSTDAPGTLSFSMSTGLPVAMPPQAMPLAIRLDKDSVGLGLWPEDILLKVKGIASFDLDKNTVSLATISGGMPGLVLGGSLSINNALDAPVTSGRISAKTAILRELCGRFGLELPAVTNPAMMRELQMEGDLLADSHAIKLSNLKSRLDDTAITGTLGVVMGKRPFWTTNLEFGSINLDHYVPATSKNNDKAVPTAFMRSFDMDARLNVKRATLLGTPFEKLRIPFTLRSGELATDVCTAYFPDGGSATATLMANAKLATSKKPASIEARLQLRLNNVNVLPVTKARKQETLIDGKAACQADLQATLFTWQDLPAKLDGNWSIDVRDGYIINAAKAAAAQQALTSQPLSGAPSHSMAPPAAASSRTQFNSITASGTILSGIVRSSNFLLTGSVLSIKGGGTLDLNNKTIDAKAIATFLGVPEVPIEISGSFTDPSTNYKVMQGVAGTIGNLSGTVLDIVGGILTAPFRILGSGK